jgi:ABC-type uncharacterized transport system involved in gliding motility auxiliary subunit
MQKKHLAAMLYSTGGVVVLIAVLIAANFVASSLNLRADLTDGKLYTLSPATRNVLSGLEAPVRVRLYYSRSSAAVPAGLKTFASRVEDLLNEYRAAAGGRLLIERFDPAPDSDAEDSAQLDGVEAQMTPTGERFYLGLAISFLDQKEAIPVLTPDRERLLEYDLTRAIAQVAAARKPVVGVMSALPVMGRPLNPLKKEQPTEPWVVISELKRSFDLREVEMDAKHIDDEINVLLVIHPRDILDETEYAIDQFLMRGGRLIAFLDPYAYFDQQPDLTNPFGGSQASASSFYNLFRAWGVELELGKVVGDLTFASGSGPRLLPTLLSLDSKALNTDDVVASQVGTLLIPFGGAFTGEPAEGLEKTVLAHSSKNSMPVDLIVATLSGEPSTRGFEPSGREMPLAVRLTGKFRTAFPEGRPRPFGAPPPDGKEAAKKEEDARPQLKESKGETSVVLVGDVDMLHDGAAVEVQEIFGQRVIIPRNGNLALAQGLVEQFSGADALMHLRSRVAFTRPLTVVRDMEARAQEQYLGKIKGLEDELIQTQEKLQELQRKRAGASSAILTAEEQAEIERFREMTAQTRQDLRDLRRDLRVETERLEFWTKVVNIGLMPLLVVLAGLLVGLMKRRRLRAMAS